MSNMSNLMRNTKKSLRLWAPLKTIATGLLIIQCFYRNIPATVILYLNRSACSSIDIKVRNKKSGNESSISLRKGSKERTTSNLCSKLRIGLQNIIYDLKFLYVISVSSNDSMWGLISRIDFRGLVLICFRECWILLMSSIHLLIPIISLKHIRMR